MEDILKIKKLSKLTWDDLAKNLPITGNALRVSFTRNSVDQVYLEQIRKDLKVQNAQKPEGKIINENELPKKEVTIIPIKGRGGLENAYYDKMYLDKLARETLTIKKPSSNGSEWFKIEVEGVSMDDSTTDFEGSKYSLCEGDWAYCRSIPKHNWRNKLHFNKVKVFCFFHNTRGILFKKVNAHDIENGNLTLSSLNKDKNKFPDFKINVSECSYICNVIKVLSEF